MNRKPLSAAAVRVRRLPRIAWACALVAFLNAACWSLITPPFQVPDEPSHFAYTQYLAETGRRPSSGGFAFSQSLEVALHDLDHAEVQYSPQNHTIFTAAQQHKLQSDLAEPLSNVSPDAGSATSEPPLYYALEVVPYAIGSSGTILDRLELMRLLSALMGACTAFFTVLFLREALPRERWAWSVGGLGVAFFPLLGLMSGAVNPDALLCALASALFYCLARGFRRGLDPALAVATGAVIAAGTFTKLNFLGLLPGALLGLLLLALRARARSPREAYRSLALAVGIGVGPLCVYAAARGLSGVPVAHAVSGGAGSSIFSHGIVHELSYIWEFYLPRLPGGEHHYFPGLFTTRQFWFDGFVGLYGWVDTVFPAWVYDFALLPFAALLVLLFRGLLQCRPQLRTRAGELAVYSLVALGLMALVGASDRLVYPSETGSFAQPRYLLPLIALFGAALVLAARGAGRRWGPVAGVAIVLLFISHDVFSQLLEISRFYG